MGLLPVKLDMGVSSAAGVVHLATEEDLFIGIRAETWTGWGIWVTLVVYLLIAGAVISQLGAMRRLRLWQSRPYVVVDSELENFLIVLVIRNAGQTGASNVRVRLDERLRSSMQDLNLDWQNSSLFTNGMTLLAPGQELRYAIDRYPDRKASVLPMAIKGSVSYGGYAKLTYRESFMIDLADYSGAMAADKGLPELAESMNSLRQSLADVVATTGRPHVVEPDWEEPQIVDGTPRTGPIVAGPASVRRDHVSTRSERAFVMFDRLLRRRP
jgi:hypothetical protein